MTVLMAVRSARFSLPAGVRANSFNRTPSTEDSFNITSFAAFRQYLIHEFFDARIAGEIIVDEFLRRLLLDSQRFRQSEGTLAVNYPKIDRLGIPSHGGGYGFQRNIIHLARHPGVDVFIPRESLAKLLIAGKMGQNAKFDLRIIGRQEQPALFAGNERRADFPPFLGAHGNVLQVRIAGTEPARGGHHLIEGSVNPARLRMDHRRQGIDVRAFQFGVLPILDQLGRQRMQRGQFFEHFGIGAGAGFRRLFRAPAASIR